MMIDLSAALPLDTPLSLILDVNSGCNFACRMCPTGDPAMLKSIGRPARMMRQDLFVKIIDDLLDFPKPIGTIQLYKMGESTLNRALPAMVAYAKKHSPRSRLELTTNASVLTRDMSAALIHAGLDYIRISVEHVTDQGYRDIAGTTTPYATILDNGRTLRDQRDRMGSKTPEIHAKIVDAGLTDSQRAAFLADWSGIADTVAINALFSWPEQPGTDLGMNPQTGMDGVTPIKHDRRVCSSAFRMMAVEADGLVTSCCVDYSGATAIGNVHTESLAQIWNGSAMRTFRLMHLRGERAQNSACASCSYMLAQPPENELDQHAARLIEAYNRAT